MGVTKSHTQLNDSTTTKDLIIKPEESNASFRPSGKNMGIYTTPQRKGKNNTEGKRPDDSNSYGMQQHPIGENLKYTQQ